MDTSDLIYLIKKSWFSVSTIKSATLLYSWLFIFRWVKSFLINYNKQEYQSMIHLIKLENALCKIDWEKLPVKGSSKKNKIKRKLF